MSNNIDKYFSDSLKAFFNDLAGISWREKLPNVLFVRDYESLPEKASFDIDILCGRKYWNSLRDSVREIALKNKLRFFSEITEKNFLFALFDVKKPNGKRTWAYFEVHEKLNFSDALTVCAEDVERDSTSKLPTPSPKWRFMLLLLQGLRKNKLSVYKDELEKILLAKKAELVSLAKSFANIDEDELVSAMDPNNIQIWRKKLKLKLPREKSKPPVSFKQKLSRYVFEKLYFIHVHNPLFYSIHGADGVGKTTAVNEVSQIFEGYPLPFSCFHHISEWKLKKSSENKEEPKKEEKEDFSIPPHRKLFKYLWKFVPSGIKRIWGFVGAELKYNSKLCKVISDYFFGGRIMLMDRYIYDNWLKASVMPDIEKAQIFVKRLNCRISRPPRLALVVTDEPEKVHQRKQQLSVESIEKYQKKIIDSFDKLTLNYKVIEVNSRMPEEIGIEIAKAILEDAGNEIIPLIGES
jgi:thymidylate kinase